MQIKNEFLGKSVARWKKETAILEKRNNVALENVWGARGQRGRGTEKKRINTPQNHILRARGKSTWHKNTEDPGGSSLIVARSWPHPLQVRGAAQKPAF